MIQRRQQILALVLVSMTLLLWQIHRFVGEPALPQSVQQAPVSSPWTSDRSDFSRSPVSPLPTVLDLDPAKVALGERLFHDPQLSQDRSISCASCHDLNRGGTDNRARSLGVGGAEGYINAPTVFNSGFQFRYFWDGRERSLEDQTDGPINNSYEMGSGWEEVIHRLNQSSEYRRLFQDSYGEGITQDTIKDTLAVFERSLITPNSPFDQYLRGDEAALSEPEQEGYRRFQSYGCISCHQGVALGGNMFQGFGIMGDYFEDRGGISLADLGRYNVTGLERDRHVFKVPSLRNVELTSPYFHDGAATTLEEAVVVMGRYQLGRRLTEEDVKLLVQFLRTLTGEYRGESL